MRDTTHLMPEVVEDPLSVGKVQLIPRKNEEVSEPVDIRDRLVDLTRDKPV